MNIYARRFLNGKCEKGVGSFGWLGGWWLWGGWEVVQWPTAADRRTSCPK